MCNDIVTQACGLITDLLTNHKWFFLVVSFREWAASLHILIRVTHTCTVLPCSLEFRVQFWTISITKEQVTLVLKTDGNSRESVICSWGWKCCFSCSVCADLPLISLFSVILFPLQTLSALFSSLYCHSFGLVIAAPLSFCSFSNLLSLSPPPPRPFPTVKPHNLSQQYSLPLALVPMCLMLLDLLQELNPAGQ